MKYLTVTLISSSILSCSTYENKQKDMGIFDKLFNKNEQKIESSEIIQDSKKVMEPEKFWSIIEYTKANSLGDYENQQTLLKKELLKLSAIKILEFNNKFRTLRGSVYNWDFWAAAYIINGGCSDDCFSDFRGWLIGQGQTIFENAIIDIETLTILNEKDDRDWEGLSYVPMESYKVKTGNEIPNGIQENFEISGNEWEEESDDLKNNYPKLWKKFN